MSEKKNVSIDSSILYRCNSKHFDKLLSKYELGYSQLIFLTQIYENEGISMNELAIQGVYDKGTITKSIQRLEQLSYVSVQNSEVDKRAKLLFTTPKAQEIMPDLYAIRQEWKAYLCKDLKEDELETYNKVLSKMVERGREYSNMLEKENSIKFYGLQKLTLLDFPGHMAATVFTGGCNFRCPFCHNRSLVFLNENDQEIAKDDILSYLESRKHILDGLAITGGEPTLHDGLRDFIEQVRAMGLKIKLDTNGSNSQKLIELVEDGLVDYVAMDIKNCPNKYASTIGYKDYDLSEVEKSVNYLLENHVEYEFRTTVVKQYHTSKDIEGIAKFIKGAKRFYLQNFEDHGSCIVEGLSEVDPETIKAMKEVCKDYIEIVEIRGVKE